MRACVLVRGCFAVGSLPFFFGGEESDGAVDFVCAGCGGLACAAYV
jgi:hypothetical protein